MAHPLTDRIERVLALQPDARAIEFDGHWSTWAELAAFAQRISAHATPGLHVGVLLRNRPQHVATLLGLMLAGATLVVINPSRGDARTRADIAALDLPVLIGGPEDVATLVETSRGSTVVTITELDELPQPPLSEHAVGQPRVAVRMLTSGTTGPPKRVDLTYGMLAKSVLGDVPSAVRAGVAIVNAPLVHIGGVYRVLQCVCEARPFVLLDRFELRTWAAAVRTHQPRAVSLVPAALRTVLHSDLSRDDLASIRAVTSGTAPLSADDADAFTEKFGVPVLTSYAATEFGGGVAGWSLADHREFWTAKRGSVGRATLGARLRVVDDDGQPLAADQAGLLEVKPGQLGPDAAWIRTTDLARIDGDGFLWILGRADQAIIRGGFKVLPDDVRAALESHPAVQGASVIGWSDRRLGEIPVAMVELTPGAAATERELIDYLSGRLARYEVPARIDVVAEIPRTPSGKADLTEVRKHFEQDARV